MYFAGLVNRQALRSGGYPLQQLHCEATASTPSTGIAQTFLGAFAILRKATISYVISVCPSVPPHGAPRLLLERFFAKFDVEDFWKICRQTSRLIQI